jgi:outer membrane lipoprotein-sorting protein
MRHKILLTLALIGTLLLAACGQQLPTAEEIVERMEAANAAMQDVHAVVAVTFNGTEQSGNLRAEVWMQRTGETDAAGRPISRVRAEVLEASEAELAGSLIVSDGASFWLYNPSANTAITGQRDELKDVPAAGGPATAMLQDLVQQGLDAVNLEVLGEEQVAGKNTWKVLVTPKPETTAQLRLDSLIQGTLWVDEELALPLKLSLDASDFGQGNVEVQSIELNSGLSADLFTFTPPAGAEIIQAADLAAQMQPRATTLDEARTSVSFALREPTYLPAGLTLVEVRTVGTTTVILNYAGAGASLSIVQSNEDVGGDREPPAGSTVSEVTVDGVPATLIEGADGQGSLLRWEANGVRYVVAGTLSGAEAVQVAEGLE